MKFHKILHVPLVDSTNRYLALKASEKNMINGLMVRAGFQTSGMGQGGNSWHSEPDKNLLCSYLYLPKKLEPVRQFYISKCAALACVSMLADHNIHCTIKWPNDIYYNNQKLGGILIENSVMGNNINRSIIGIGININQKTFTALPNPVSAVLIKGYEFKLNELAEQLRNYLTYYYGFIDNGDFSKIDDKYINKLYRKKAEALFKTNSSMFKGTIETVLPSGQLQIQTPNGIETFWFKEVEFII